jgi:Fe-S cluster assembly iron-binding protein IscA
LRFVASRLRECSNPATTSAPETVLTVTPLASELIWQLVDACGVPEWAGVRIWRAEPTQDGAPLELALVERPEPGDEVVAVAGARVFFDPAVAPDVAGTVLDAELVGEGRIRFALREGRRRASRNGNG